MTCDSGTVTALVLSIGEATTARAISSLTEQTCPCHEIIVIENVTPFHAAMNAGIAKVSTPFFIQCDADMNLDPDCVETLLCHFTDTVGVTLGYLEDRMLGYVQAVKMFRTECFRNVQFTNHISPDTDTIAEIASNGWELKFAERDMERYGHPCHILGMHDPEYTSIYTYNKFKLEGARMRHRGIFGEFREMLKTLSASSHPMAVVAIIGICQGLVKENESDGLKPFDRCEEFGRLESYMNSRSRPENLIDRGKFGRFGDDLV